MRQLPVESTRVLAHGGEPGKLNVLSFREQLSGKPIDLAEASAFDLPSWCGAECAERGIDRADAHGEFPRQLLSIEPWIAEM